MTIAGRVSRFGYRVLLFVEHGIKEILFDCSMCGQCITRTTGLICPRTCPKGIRNGPCGGAEDGMCEVYRDRRCVWCRIYERNQRFGRPEKIEKILPPIDWSLVGTSAWANVLVGKADMNGMSARYKGREESGRVEPDAADKGAKAGSDTSVPAVGSVEGRAQGERP